MNSPIFNISETEIVAQLGKPENSQYSEVNTESLLKIFPAPPRKAAVLVPLLIKEENWHILFIHRTEDSKEHSGQVAFPGGRLEYPEEPMIQAALRETQEEIGVSPDKVKILGELKPIFTISNYKITPIIGIIPWPYPFKIQVQEVKHIFTIPLQWLADPANWEIRNRIFSPLAIELPVVYFKKYDDELLWGVSGRIMLNFLNQLAQ
jgi:8-oxo-dGTP pyrophosphatase MutT (NUDIX family)